MLFPWCLAQDLTWGRALAAVYWVNLLIARQVWKRKLRRGRVTPAQALLLGSLNQFSHSSPVVQRQDEAPCPDVSERQFSTVSIAIGHILQKRKLRLTLNTLLKVIWLKCGKSPVPTYVSVLFISLLCYLFDWGTSHSFSNSHHNPIMRCPFYRWESR